MAVSLSVLFFLFLSVSFRRERPVSKVTCVSLCMCVCIYSE